MKLPVSFIRHHLLLVTLTCVLLIGTAGSAEVLHHVSAQSNHQFRPERQLSPVFQPERALMNMMNSERERLHMHPFDPEWNLFRSARIAAQKLEKGQDERIAMQEADNIINTEEKNNQQTVHHIILRESKKKIPVQELWRQLKQRHVFIDRTTKLQIGIGYAAGDQGRIWVILLKELHPKRGQ
ncbi:hypothetical protein ACFP7A_03180 [Sporolactobacillus kofuensis]|uniref:SCP domain-containing protein n=1 Tax=Sporolactobacillus kofuensis TaxID=269672 RepID=A0ABW1WET5_9BACL|nr:hypothetical protein [Sporolactobacillus kofuensis]MCO7174595.1 hypothetical protein [Sporolactobacillus kofuensis]